MKIKILESASNDIKKGYEFYESRQDPKQTEIDL